MVWLFEHNLPEAVRLYKRQPAVGDTVNILAPRGKKETEENSVPQCVKYIDNGVACHLMGLFDSSDQDIYKELILSEVNGNVFVEFKTRT